MAETGAVCGPTKLSLLTAWSPGPDGRAGILIDKQPAAFVRDHRFDRILGNFDVLKSYSYLFAFNYGSGLAAYNLSADGFLRDAFVLAARLDYAVASNLNLFGGFLYANRTSQGYSWGCIGPNAGLAGSVFAAESDGNISIAWIDTRLLPISPTRLSGTRLISGSIGSSWRTSPAAC